jgi:hypothetical protein
LWKDAPPADMSGMAALRKLLFESPDDRLPLLLVVNHEIHGVRHRSWTALFLKLLLLCIVVFGVLNMFHGIARG